MTFQEWCKEIIRAVRGRLDVTVVEDENGPSVTFNQGERGAILRALSNSTASLSPALEFGGAIEEGTYLSSRAQWMEARHFSIDTLSAPHVAGAILAILSDSR
jgi:hypothetical protein